MQQSKMDSFLEAATNTGIGFFISWAVWLLIIEPLYGIEMSVSGSFSITCIFTVTSILRSYILRRVFNGRTVWQVLKEKFQ